MDIRWIWRDLIEFLKKGDKLTILVQFFKNNEINWIKILFFVFSFTTFLTHGFTNIIFINKIKHSSIILLLLLVNIMFFALGKIYGSLINSIPLRLISYIFITQAILSLPFVFKGVLISAIFTYIKSFLYGVQYSIIFSMMRSKTENWKLKKFTFPIITFITINILPNIIIYLLGGCKFYINLLMELTMGIIFYKISTNNIDINEVVEDTEKLTDYKLILNALFNSVNSVILFIIQKERDILIGQFIHVVLIVTKVAFVVLLNKKDLFQNPDTLYYILIQTLESLNSKINNETINYHLNHMCQRLRYRMFKKSLNDENMETRIVRQKNNPSFFAKIIKKILRK